jgi:hypothetical protein
MDYLVENLPDFSLIGGDLDFGCIKLTCSGFGACYVNCGTVTCETITCGRLIMPED